MWTNHEAQFQIYFHLPATTGLHVISFFPDDNKYFLCLLLKSFGAILCTVTVTFHLHNGVLRDVLAASILLRFAPRFVVIVTRDEHHGAPLEPLEGPTLPFLRISVDVCLEICIERSKVGVLVRL